MTDLLTQAVVPSPESYRFIPLTQGQLAVVDAADFEWLNQWLWSAHRNSGLWYAERKVNYKPVGMHTFILGSRRGLFIDHWNGDGLDNRRANLRFVTTIQNGANRRGQHHNISGYPGVSFCERRNRWKVSLRSRGVYHHGGYFALALLNEAIAARQSLESAIFGAPLRALAPARIVRPTKFSVERPPRVRHIGLNNLRNFTWP